MTETETERTRDERPGVRVEISVVPPLAGEVAGCLGALAARAKSAARLAARAAMILPPYFFGHVLCHAKYFARLVSGAGPAEPTERPWWCPPDLWTWCGHRSKPGPRLGSADDSPRTRSAATKSPKTKTPERSKR